MDSVRLKVNFFALRSPVSVVLYYFNYAFVLVGVNTNVSPARSCLFQFQIIISIFHFHIMRDNRDCQLVAHTGGRIFNICRYQCLVLNTSILLQRRTKNVLVF